MKNKFSKYYYIYTMINIFISAIVAIIVELFISYNAAKIVTISKLSGRKDVFDFAGETQQYVNLLYFILGIIVFSIIFMILEYRNVNSYISLTLKGMEEKISELMTKERSNEKTKNDLITNVAHDLRTPLTSVIGYLEILKDNSNKKDESLRFDKETEDKYINIAFSKSKRLQLLIEELFSFTKTTYKDEGLILKRIDIVALINQLLDETYPIFEKNKLTYDVETLEKKIFINADGNMIARLFDNLFSNAIKYGVDGKRIVVRIKNDKERNMLTIDVINFGKIIPSKEIDKIFEQFYRTDRARQSKTGGSGLGLAIAKNIAIMHGGDITVSSDENGTKFSVQIKTDLKENVEQN